MTSYDSAAEATRVALNAVRAAATEEWRDDVKYHLDQLATVLEERPTAHVIDFAEHGWTIMHPLVGCGLHLFDCPVNEAAERGLTRPDRYARFRCDVDPHGRLVIGDEIQANHGGIDSHA